MTYICLCPSALRNPCLFLIWELQCKAIFVFSSPFAPSQGLTIFTANATNPLAPRLFWKDVCANYNQLSSVCCFSFLFLLIHSAS